MEPSFLSRSPTAALPTCPGGLVLGLSPRHPNTRANLEPLKRTVYGISQGLDQFRKRANVHRFPEIPEGR